MNKQILYLLVLLFVTLSYALPCAKVKFSSFGQEMEGRIATQKWCNNYCKIFNLTQLGSPCSCLVSYEYGTEGSDC